MSNTSREITPVDLSGGAALAVLSLVAGSVVAIEVLLTRLLSLAAYYGLAFAILSLAMLGLSAGSLQAIRARERGEALRPWLARRLLSLAASVIVATAVVAAVPLSFTPNLSSLLSVLLVASAAAAPMVLGGSVVARILGESRTPLATLYGVDLASAAVGALAPLALLGPLSGPSALLALSALLAAAGTVLAPKGARLSGVLLVAATGVAMGLTETTSYGLVVLYAKGKRSHPEAAAYQRWSPLGHVELRPFLTEPVEGVLWAPSPVTPDGKYIGARAVIDGDAGTFVHAYSELSSLDVLRFDATTVAHRLRPTGPACVIGVGGGRDLLAALVYGHDQVLGVEINPAIVKMLEAAVDRSPVLRDPRIRIVAGDGRAELTRPGVSCRVLQATLVDTWAATSAGAFAHSEATIYTLEAWRLFLRRVEPDGIVAFSRWFDQAHTEETARLVALAVAALLDRGAERPRDHIALIASGNVATILLGPSPLSKGDLAALHDLNAELHFPILLAPDLRPSGSLIDDIAGAKAIDGLGRYGEPLGLDTSAPTDDRPFFFQLRSAKAWLHPIDALRGASPGGVLAGNSAAMFQLLLTFAAVLVVGGALLGPTLVRAARSSPSLGLPGTRAAVYFASLGAGFMMTEIALVQRMHVVLGHPTYALVVVLAGLLVATGAGSALSPRILRSRKSVNVAALLSALLLVVLPYAVIGPLARATLESALGLRVACAAGCSGITGLLLGMLFPAGIRYVSREAGVPVALAINGFTSVLGSTVAIVLSVWVDIPTTLVCAGIVYAVAGLAGPLRWGTAPESEGRQP